MKPKKTRTLLLLVIVGVLSSCKTSHLNVVGVGYQSIRAKNPVQSIQEVPDDATIIVCCKVGGFGSCDVIVKNNTDKIMTIDRTRSFFRNQSGNSIPYYDPTVKVQSQSTTVGAEKGASVNLGSLASAAGIGGALGTALGGVNVGGSQSNALTNTNTTYIVDQPQLSIAPHGQASMGRDFNIEGVGLSFLNDAIASCAMDVNNTFTPVKTYAACNICISYSVDDGKTYETVQTDLYANSLVIGKVKQTGQVNEALRYIYANKTDALTEPWHVLYFLSDSKKNNNKVQTTEFLNYK